MPPAGLNDKHTLEPTKQHLESSCEREQSRGLCRYEHPNILYIVSYVKTHLTLNHRWDGLANAGPVSRSRRSRRGPVIEADGMLKMFHCPYAGCSQVYVAISSYQVTLNLPLI